jgi:hypothetical protein
MEVKYCQTSNQTARGRRQDVECQIRGRFREWYPSYRPPGLPGGCTTYQEHQNGFIPHFAAHVLYSGLRRVPSSKDFGHRDGNLSSSSTSSGSARELSSLIQARFESGTGSGLVQGRLPPQIFRIATMIAFVLIFSR